jgi:hypothetical protein
MPVMPEASRQKAKELSFGQPHRKLSITEVVAQAPAQHLAPGRSIARAVHRTVTSSIGHTILCSRGC